MVRYAQGDYGCFQELYGRYSSRVYGFLKSRVRGEGEADDMLQQVFLKVHQHRQSFDPCFPFVAWIFTITRNVLIDHFRKHRATPIEQNKLSSLVDSSVSHQADGELEWSEILGLLSVDQRKLIEQRFEQGLSYEQIASESGLPAASVRKRLSRSVQMLRARLAQGKGQRK